MLANNKQVLNSNSNPNSNPLQSQPLGQSQYQQNKYSYSQTNPNKKKQFIRNYYASHNNSTMQQLDQSGQIKVFSEHQFNKKSLQNSNGLSNSNHTHHKTYKTSKIKSKANKMKSRNRLQVNSRSRSQSRSSSCSYSYCEANFMKKSVVKVKNKPNDKVKATNTKKKCQQNQINNKNVCNSVNSHNKNNLHKLYNAIQQFYTNLSNMSLDLLLSHENPPDWLTQQTQTCRQLQQKLHKTCHIVSMNPQNKQNTHNNNHMIQNTKKSQEFNEHYDYYLTKLHTVFGILDNIKNNLHMLNSINQQELRDCYSSTNSLTSSVSGSLANSTIKDLHTHLQKINSANNLLAGSPLTLNSDRSLQQSLNLLNIKPNNDNKTKNNSSKNTVPTSLRMSLQKETKTADMDTKQTRNNSKSAYTKNHLMNQNPHPKTHHNNLNKISQYKIQQSLYEIRDQPSSTYVKNSTTGSNQSLQDQNQHSPQNNNIKQQNSLQNDSYITMLKKFNTNIVKIANKNINSSSNPITDIKNTNFDTNTSKNMPNNKLKQNFMITTCKSQQSPQVPKSSMNKGILNRINDSLQQNYSHESMRQRQNQNRNGSSSRNKNSKTQRIHNLPKNIQSIQSLSQLIAKSLVSMSSGSPTRNSQQYLRVLLNNIRMFDSQGNTIKSNMYTDTLRANPRQNLTKPKNIQTLSKYKYSPQSNNAQSYNSSAQSSKNISTLKPLLIQITELKTQLEEKNAQIQNLLSYQQQLQAVVQMYKSKQRDNEQSHGFAIERIRNLQSVIDRYEKQITRMKQSDHQLRQTAKNQSTYITTLHRQKQQLQQNMSKQTINLSKMNEQVQRISKKYNDEIKILKKKQKISEQKMQIYKQKYYQLLHQVELKKIVIDGSYSGKVGKVREIWGILAQHRKNLLGIDEDQQQKQLQNNSKPCKQPQKSQKSYKSQLQFQQQDNLSNQLSNQQTI